MHLIEIKRCMKRIHIRGHAGYAENGKDIVCAGVTALVQTLVMSVNDLTKDKLNYEISPGRANIDIGNLTEDARLLVDSFFIGVGLIADEFPDYVRIENCNGMGRERTGAEKEKI